MKRILTRLIFADADYVNIMVLQKVQYQLWMILNIPGDNITAGELLTEYMGPNPEKDNLRKNCTLLNI